MLTLVEETLLLALDDKSGRFLPVPEYSLELASAGAVLMDLALRDRLDSDIHELILVDPTPTGDEILDPVLLEMNRLEGVRGTRAWLMRLAKRDSIRDGALNRLVERGILRREEKKLLWVFGSRRYPAVDNTDQREAKLRILEVLFNNQIPDPRDVVLICLASACSLFQSILTPGELQAASERIDQVARMDLIGQRMLKELRDLHETVNRVGYWGVSRDSDSK